MWKLWKLGSLDSLQSWDGCETCFEKCFKNCFDGCFEDCFDWCFKDGFKDCSQELGGQELEVELSRAEPGAWAESGQGPSRARSRDAGGLDLGLGLEGLYWKLVRNVWSGCGNQMHCL